MQLVAYGAQDVYLTGNPQITFWKVTYRRHTNFAVESIEQTFNGQADFGRRVQCTVSRNGDLAYRTYLQVTLPEVGGKAEPGLPGVAARWLDYPGEQLISQVEVEIGGQRIDRQYGDWMHIWNQLVLNDCQRRGYNKMIGQTPELTYLTNPMRRSGPDSPCSSGGSPQTCEIRNALPQTTLYVPLQFWFCRNPGLAIPLIALQYHEVKINMDFNTLDQCLWAVRTDDTLGLPLAGNVCKDNGFDLTNNNTLKQNKPERADEEYQGCCLVSASLYIDYVFLDTDERRRMAQNPHEYLIEQLQFTGDESIGSTSNKIKLNFNHPCKELVWVVQSDSVVDYCGSFVETEEEASCSWAPEYKSSGSCCGGAGLYSLHGAQPFNYTDAVDVIPRSWHAYGNLALTQNELIHTKGDKCCKELSRLANPWSCNVQCSDIGVLDDPDMHNDHAFDGLELPSGNGVDADTFDPLFGNNGLPLKAPVNDGRHIANDPAMKIGDGGSTAASAAWGNSSVSTAGTIVLGQTSRNMHCWGENPVVTAKLLLNGQDRFSERLGTYFDTVQPFQHHTANPDTGINVYSFALRPEEHQPSGTCNFSRIDNASLQLCVSANSVGGAQTAKVRVYATNYNVLRVMSGMGGLAYSN